MIPNRIWDKVFKNGLSKFFKDCLSQSLIRPLLSNFVSFGFHTYAVSPSRVSLTGDAPFFCNVCLKRKTSKSKWFTNHKGSVNCDTENNFEFCISPKWSKHFKTLLETLYIVFIDTFQDPIVILCPVFLKK